jgi:hypothetical protein
MKYMTTTTHRRSHCTTTVCNWKTYYYCVQLKNVRDFLFRFWNYRSRIAISSFLFFRVSSRFWSSSSLSSVPHMWACISLMQISSSILSSCLARLSRISSISSKYSLLLSIIGIFVYHSGDFSMSIHSQKVQGWNKWISWRGQRNSLNCMNFAQNKEVTTILWSLGPYRHTWSNASQLG